MLPALGEYYTLTWKMVRKNTFIIVLALLSILSTPVLPLPLSLPPLLLSAPPPSPPLSPSQEFPHSADTCYLAHCYPYSYSTLLGYLTSVEQCPLRGRYVRKEVGEIASDYIVELRILSL